jgi:hypoxanthine phosphoribosyltransferase
MEFFNAIKIEDKIFEQYMGKYEINSIVQDIANNININYANISSVENPLIIIGVLNGAFMFLSDLVKKIIIPCEIHFIKVSSYINTTSSGQVTNILGLTRDIANHNVLVVEDIIETGTTMVKLLDDLSLLNPTNIELCTFLYKSAKCMNNLDIKYIGKEIEDKFVIGYGLDYNNLGRQYDTVYSLITDIE